MENFNHKKARLYILIGVAVLVILFILWRRNQVQVSGQTIAPPINLPTVSPNYTSYNVPPTSKGESALPVVQPGGPTIAPTNINIGGCGCGGDAAGSGLLSNYSSLEQSFANAATNAVATYNDNIVSAMPAGMQEMLNNPLGAQQSAATSSFFGF